MESKKKSDGPTSNSCSNRNELNKSRSRIQFCRFVKIVVYRFLDGFINKRTSGQKVSLYYSCKRDFLWLEILLKCFIVVFVSSLRSDCVYIHPQN